MPAKHLGISRAILHWVWQRHDVQPHRMERFKLSNDPPERALVLGVDGKSRMQALDRTVPARIGIAAGSSSDS